MEFGKKADAARMISPRVIAGDLYVETNFSAQDLVGRIKTLLSLCHVPFEDVKIFYEKRGGNTAGGTAWASNEAETNENNKFSSTEHNAFDYLDKTDDYFIWTIKQAERYAVEHGYKSHVLFSDDRMVTISTAAELLQDPGFLEYDAQRSKRFSTAVKELLKYIGAEIPESKAAEPAPQTDSEIASVLKEHFQYGFRPDFIDLRRFRQFAAEEDIALPDDDEELKRLIRSSGVEINGDIYPIREEMPRELREMVGDIFASGATTIYYESLFEKQRQWMELYRVTSPERLKEYLKRYLPECSFSKNYVGRGTKSTERDAVTEELKRVWGERPLRSIAQLSELLPYIPEEAIRRLISGNNSFVWVREGVYFPLDRFLITDEEEAALLDFVEKKFEKAGFVSFSDLPVESLEEENYELTELAICYAVYRKVLSGKYQLNGKFLTRKGQAGPDVVTLLKEYLRDKDECTLKEVEDQVIELTGGANRQYAFRALYDTMVRVTKNRFVAPRFVYFPVEKVDEVLSGFIPDRFRAIKAVTTFAMFPHCGQAWNHYLLESFCYRYSKRYRLCVINFNDKNAGIIAENAFDGDYDEMLSAAVARAKPRLELSSDVIGEYLFDSGYLAKRTDSRMEEIVRRASELRDRR